MKNVKFPSCWNPDYPRPQLRRDRYFSLNGLWQLNGASILVPYPPQSKLSGYTGEIKAELRYEKSFTLPEDFLPASYRLILHIGAADQVADVSLNGRPVAHHEGGYLPFSADITDALCQGENALEVLVFDDLSRDYPYGKQHKRPHGMWYTPISGIWQSIWLEAVPEQYIRSLRITPDLTGITLEVETDAEEYTVTIALGQSNLSRTFRQRRVRIDLASEGELPHLWTPDDPYLYDLTIQAGSDEIKSYFALRTVEINTVGGSQRICLNGQPIFLHGLLDQGYFSDGIYLPEDAAEYERDVQRMKELGFNLLRKHIKIEPEAFYYACDRQGMLVLQDMVNNGSYNWLLDTALPNIGLQRRPDCFPGNQRRKAIFQSHAIATQRHLYNHPCIIGYTIFNEGWGQFDADWMYALCKKEDPTRFYDATSGWFAQKDSDVDSRHVYFKNKVLRSNGRPLLLSECGGYSRLIKEHLYKPDASYGYGTTDSEEALMAKITALYDQMVIPSMANGLCGCIYTQVSDVEEEVNGLYTYDRARCKVDPAQMQALARKLHTMFRNSLS